MPPPLGGEFRLTDHHGASVTDRSFLGRPALLYFGFTHCRVICPRALTRLSRALDLAGFPPTGFSRCSSASIPSATRPR